MGTPHQGSDAAYWGLLLEKIVGTVIKTDDNVLKHLQSNSEWLHQTQDLFNSIAKRFETTYAYERKDTKIPYSGKSVMVVPRHSAIVFGDDEADQISINADHIGMVKFSNIEDPGYKKVSIQLGIMAKNAEALIEERWKIDKKKRDVENGKDEKFHLYFDRLMPATGCFVARENELKEIHRKLTDGQRIIVIHGLGGMGKTQLAAKYFRDKYEEYSHVLWLNIKDEDSVKQSFMRIAEEIKAGDPDMKDLATTNPNIAFNGVSRWLGKEKNWLMVYDNYDNPKSAKNGSSDEGAVDIRDFLPLGNHGSIIITTTSSRVAIGERVELKKLNNTDSLNVLSHLAKKNAARNNSDVEKRAKHELANELDGHPLALTAAGTYIDTLDIGYTEYLQLYRESWRNLQDTTPLWESYGKENARLYTTWQLSFENVKKRNKLAANLLELWAYFDSQDLWFGLLEQSIPYISAISMVPRWASWVFYSYHGSIPEWFQELVRDKVKFNSAISALQDYGLVSVGGSDMSSTSYSMHSCVHSWTTHVLNRTLNVENMVIVLMCLGVEYADDIAGWRTRRRVVRHAIRWSNMLAKNIDTFYDGGGRFYYSYKAVTFVQKIFLSLFMSEAAAKLGESFTRLLHKNPLQVVRFLLSKGETLEPRVDLFTYKGNVEKIKKVVGKTWEGTEVRALAEFYLGNAYREKGELVEARDAYLRATTACDVIDVVDDSGYSLALEAAYWLSETSLQLDIPDEAERWARWRLERLEEKHPLNRENVLLVQVHLAKILIRRGKRAEVEEIALLAVQQWEDSCGHVPLETRPLALGSFGTLASVYYDLGRFDKGKELDLKILPALETCCEIEILARLKEKIERRLEGQGDSYTSNFLPEPADFP
ncbi:hypothetical protein MauCBS54593_001961 [Microsporum audouinii]